MSERDVEKECLVLSERLAAIAAVVAGSVPSRVESGYVYVLNAEALDAALGLKLASPALSCLSARLRAAEQALQAFVVPVTSAQRVRGYVSMRVSVEAIDAARTAVLRPTGDKEKAAPKDGLS